MKKILIIIIMSAGFTFLTHCGGEGEFVENSNDSSVEENLSKDLKDVQKDVRTVQKDVRAYERAIVPEENFNNPVQPQREDRISCVLNGAVLNYVLYEGSYNKRLSNGLICTLDVYNTSQSSGSYDWSARNELDYCAERLKEAVEQKRASGWVCS